MPTDNFELDEFLPYLLNQSAEVSSLAFQQVYKDRYGMLRTEWRVLFHLGLYGSMTASEIGGRARLHKTKISRAVQRLAERRFLTRTKDKSDRRVEHLALTTQGEAAYKDLRETARQYEDKLLGVLTPQEGAMLRRALIKLSQVDPGRFT